MPSVETVGRKDAGGEPGTRLGNGLIGSRKLGSSLQVRSWGGGEILGLVGGGRLPLQTPSVQSGCEMEPRWQE